MYKALYPGAIGVSMPTLEAGLEAAKIGGFEGLELNIEEIADRIEANGVADIEGLFQASGIRPAGWGLPVDWRTTDEAWKRDLAALPRLAKAGQAVGARRVATWVPAASNERDFDENHAFHIRRFTPIAAILNDHGCALGLEFIGPKTKRDSFKYSFIHTMSEMLALGREIGPNVGVLLDAWHWHTSHGTVAEIRALSAKQVVYVHVNDAPAGIPLDEQLDHTRCLPAETGVIDAAGFLQALDAIGYDGPLVPEPFKKELGELPSDEARLKAVGAAMDRMLAQSHKTTEVAAG